MTDIGHRIFDIAVDEGFPHVLIRSFAKSGAIKLVESGYLNLNPNEVDLLQSANTSLLVRVVVDESRRVVFDRYTYRQSQNRRFDFDVMDTLPYWYSEALQIFADVSDNLFLETAEKWIVDRWEEHGDFSAWKDEPRGNRLSSRHATEIESSHRSKPIYFRFHPYLEWHAMWCTVGDLMRTQSLVKTDADDYESFENWVAREALTIPPWWIADLVGAKPCETQLWYAPQDIDTWLESVQSEAFDQELKWPDDTEMLVVNGHHETQSSKFMQTVRVASSLVSPLTASALIRALQTIDDSGNYRLPPTGNSLEINTANYKLVGWLIDTEQDMSIDEHDPLCFQTRYVEYSPADQVVESLNLALDYDKQLRWSSRSTRELAFICQAWGENQYRDTERTPSHDESVRSSGWRLRASKDAIRRYLGRIGLDLIVEVEITRRNSNYEYRGRDEKEIKEARYDRVLLLRRDGTIEDAKGYLGTWTIPGP